MKAGTEHRVPLSAAAIALLEEMAERRQERIAARIARPAAGTDFVFPNATGKQLSDMTLTLLLRRMNRVEEGQEAPWRDGKTGEPITPHGFRSTFRMWASEETAYPREIIEAAMAHAVSDKSDLLEKRRAPMEDWEKFCGPSS